LRAAAKSHKATPNPAMAVGPGWRVLAKSSAPRHESSDTPTRDAASEARFEGILVDAGFQISGVATRLSKALSLIETVACDVAIVDANLCGSSTGPAAAALAARGLPFIVLSGYTHGQLQSEFSSGSFVQKPYRTGELVDRLRAILSKR